MDARSHRRCRQIRERGGFVTIHATSSRTGTQVYTGRRTPNLPLIKSKPWELPSTTLGPNPYNPSPTLPTLADIQRRCGELLAHQSRHKSAQALATPGEPHTEVDLHLPEEFTQEQEEQQESAEFRAEFQAPYAVEGLAARGSAVQRSGCSPWPAFGCPDRVPGGASSDDRCCGTQKASGDYSLILVL
jgi:hypothetical protein